MHSYHFGKLPCGRSVEAYRLTNASGMELIAITYGGIVTTLSAPDRHGRMADVVLGFNELEPYLARHPYFGAITGRVAGRIPDGRFKLDGTTCQLAINDGTHHLHGGWIGLDQRVWDASPVDRPDGADSLRLRYLSPDGEEGYPGNVDITVTYTLTDANEFIIDTEATSDRPAPLSLTHHSYFNLPGEGCGPIEDHQLQVHSDLMIPVDSTLAPLGRTQPVTGEADDFNSNRRFGDALPGLFQQHGGLYLIRRSPDESLAHAAELSDPASGRVLTVTTTEACLQLYSALALDGTLIGKSGNSYPRFAGLCLECEGYSDGVNVPDFGDIIVRPGMPQKNRTIYAFANC
jgi:aldose 1-epimerase